MKLFNLLKAGEALKRLSEKRIANYKTARAIFALRKKVDEEQACYVAEERKLIELYAVKGEDGKPVIFPDGRINLKNEEAKELFERELLSIRETEISTETIHIKESDFRSPDDIPSPEDMYLLDGLVLFEEE